MSNTPIPPAANIFGGDRDPNDERLSASERLDGQADAPMDPDLDEDRQTSAAADEQAATEGVADGDVPNE